MKLPISLYVGNSRKIHLSCMLWLLFETVLLYSFSLLIPMMYVRNVVIHRTVHTIWSRLCSYMGSTEKASMVNALQFMASSFCMITLARSTLRNSRSASVRGGSSSSNLVDKRYASTLTEMFKATKVPNKRHGLNCSSADTTENIFRSRCEFFRKAVVDYNLQNVKFIHIAGTKGKGKFLRLYHVSFL